jgi:hypothetical protein
MRQWWRRWDVDPRLGAGLILLVLPDHRRRDRLGQRRTDQRVCRAAAGRQHRGQVVEGHAADLRGAPEQVEDGRHDRPAPGRTGLGCTDRRELLARLRELMPEGSGADGAVA